MDRRPITQQEIAQRVGVSVATVSRALNDRPGVSPALRSRILTQAREIGYVPDVSARSLATSVTHAVAFVVHQANHATLDDPFYPIIMAGAETYLAQHDYHILLTTLDDEAMARPREFSVISQRRADGLILAGPDISATFILSLVTAGVPLVLVDNSLSQTAVNCVVSDDEGGASGATRHLMGQGHSDIVFLSGPERWASNRERARGYQRAMKEADLVPRMLRESETTIASGEVMMQRALERWPHLTAVCAVNDAVAIGAIRAAARSGRRTPDDLAVVGFDDISWAQVNEPSLTTVHVFKRRIGSLAAQRLLDCIQNPTAAPVKAVVATELVLRESCGHGEPREAPHRRPGRR
jgi:DNA-binding LacI/PurR family transcriptional regulator